MSDRGGRYLSPMLLLGMLISAPVFCWFFLRRGYAPSLRRTAFTFAAIMFLVPLIGRLGE